MRNKPGDHILIIGLRARCVIGVRQNERRRKQDVVMDLDITTDTRKAAKTDAFGDALDYRRLKKKVLRFTEQSRYHLLEALAGAIAELCLEEPEAESVTVKVEKPAALRFARSVGVMITRYRK